MVHDVSPGDTVTISLPEYYNMARSAPTHTLGQRIAFANGVARLVLKYATIDPRYIPYIEGIRDAVMMDDFDLQRIRAVYYKGVPAAVEAVESSASFLGARKDADRVYLVNQACRLATEAGVPREQLDALRAITIGLDR